MGYDCVLILEGKPKKRKCRDYDRNKLKPYFIGYFVTLGEDDIKCTMRKTLGKPPTSKDRYRIKGMINNVNYVNSILSTLRQIQEKGDKFTLETDKSIYSIHSLTMKKSIDTFLEDADIQRTLITIKHGGV